MPLPVEVQTVTVTFGPFNDFLGAALKGETIFTPSTEVKTSSGVPLVAAPLRVVWDGTGSGTITLPASDSTGLDRTGFTYEVTHRTYATGVPAPRGGPILLSAAVPVVDLEDLVEVPTSSGVTVSVPLVTALAGLSGELSAQQAVDALGGPLRAAFVPFWIAAEVVTTGTRRMAPDGKVIVRNSDGTTRPTYDATEQALWTVIGGGTSYTDEQAQDAVAALFAAGAHTGIVFTYDDAGNRIGAAVSDATKTPLLTPTATKTATYTAAVGDLAMMNVAGGGTVLNLPAAPADKSQVGYRAIGATTAVPLTVNRGGSDTIGTAGATSATVPLADEVVVLQYQASTGRWLAVANVKPLPALDARFDAAGAAAFARMAADTPIPSTGKYASAAGTTTTAPAAGGLRAYPITLGAAGTADRIGIEVTTLAVGSTIALGIYAHDTATGLPGTRILDAGTVSGAATGFMEITINQALPAATYWLALLSLGGAPTMRAVATTAPVVIPNFSQSELAAVSIAVLMTGQSSLPATFVAGSAINNCGRVYLRFS